MGTSKLITISTSGTSMPLARTLVEIKVENSFFLKESIIPSRTAVSIPPVRIVARIYIYFNLS